MAGGRRVALVTGGGRGLGRAIARDLAGAGFAVGVNYLERTEAAETTVEEIRSAGGTAVAVQGDVRVESETARLTDAVASALGPIDTLVNNAGISRDAIAHRMSLAEWGAVIATNLQGAFLCSRAVLPGMRERKFGRIINISSVVGLAGGVGVCNYAASKAGLEGLTRALALENARHGITVNVIAPGYFEVGLIESLPPDRKAEILSRIPAGRLGRPAELSSLVLYLASEQAAYLTGQTLSPNGGFLF